MSQQSQHFYEFGAFRLDVGERLLLRDGASVPITPKAFDLLLVLVEQQGHLLEKEKLLKLVWPDTFVEEANLSYNISLIRKALGEAETGQKFIETVPKRGYRFAAEVREVTAESASAVQSPLQPDAGSDGIPLPTLATLEKRNERLRTEVKSYPRKTAVAVAAFVLVAGIAAGLYWLTRQAPLRRAEPKIVPFTSFPGHEGEPAFSPDGNRIAFFWRGPNDDNADIYIKQPGAEGVLRLTTDPAEDVGPDWSPDGRHIAFLRRSDTGSGIYLAPALGGGERKLAEVFKGTGLLISVNRPPTQNPDWAPDGRLLAIVDKSSPSEPFSIFLLEVETGEKRPLTRPPATAYGDTSPAFSPDGKLLAFVRVPGIGVADVYVMPATGGEPRRLTFGNQPVGRVTWTANSREIVFDTGPLVGRGSLWRVAVSGGNPEQIVAAGQMTIDPAIAPVSERLAWAQSLYDTNIWRLELTGAKRDRRSVAREFISSTQLDNWPEYSPDGRRILFMSVRSGSPEIWVCGPEGENPVQLTNLNTHTGTPHWSSDSRNIVFDSRPDGNSDIYVVSVEGGKPRRLTTDPAEDFCGSWSRDGQWIWFGSARSGSLQIWKMPAHGGEAVQMTKQGGFEGFESPDGKYFYYTKGRNTFDLWRIPVAGGEETPVLEHNKSRLLRAWKVVNEGIYFAAAESPTHLMIKFFDFATGKLMPVAPVEKPFSLGLSISPDGRWLIYAQVDHTGRDIMLMENFR